MENNEKISVVVIDDSAFMRKSISMMLQSDKDIFVAATARDGEDGYQKVLKLKPDIVTLDVEMPGVDGLTALRKIMRNCPTNVLMVSSITTEGAAATLKALELGAIDFIPTDLSSFNNNILKIKEDLIFKIKEIVKLRNHRGRFPKQASYQVSESAGKKIESLDNIFKMNFEAVAVGISTGGPMSLQKMLPEISADIKVPLFIVQHMPPRFTKSLADRLNSLSKIEVKEAVDNEEVKPGVAYLAPGGFHLKLKNSGPGFVSTFISEQPENLLHRPSVDVMLNSVIDIYGKNIVAFIMTGMGRDGLEGVSRLKKTGGSCIAQNEATCVVYGMPKSVVEAGLADAVVPLEKFSDIINKYLV